MCPRSILAPSSGMPVDDPSEMDEASNVEDSGDENSEEDDSSNRSEIEEEDFSPLVFQGTLNCAPFLLNVLRAHGQFLELRSLSICFNSRESGVDFAMISGDGTIQSGWQLNLIDYHCEQVAEVSVYAPSFDKLLQSCTETSRIFHIKATEKRIYLEASTPFTTKQFSLRNLTKEEVTPEIPLRPVLNSQGIYLDATRLRQTLNGWLKTYPDLKNSNITIENRKDPNNASYRHLRFSVYRESVEEYDLSRLSFMVRQRKHDNIKFYGRLTSTQEPVEVEVDCALSKLQRVLDLTHTVGSQVRFDVANGSNIRLQYECDCRSFHPPRIFDGRQIPHCTMLQVFVAPILYA